MVFPDPYKGNFPMSEAGLKKTSSREQNVLVDASEILHIRQKLLEDLRQCRMKSSDERRLIRKYGGFGQIQHMG